MIIRKPISYISWITHCACSVTIVKCYNPSIGVKYHQYAKVLKVHVNVVVDILTKSPR